MDKYNLNIQYVSESDTWSGGQEKSDTWSGGQEVTMRQ